MSYDLSERDGYARRLTLLVVAGLVGWMVAGCGPVEPRQPTSEVCAVDTDCDEGNYCGTDGSCTSDCDPNASGASACGDGESCSARGRCVADSCSGDMDCPSGQYCSGAGSCTSDCDPSDGSSCGADEQCTERGRCQAAGECAGDMDCTEPPEASCEGNTLTTYGQTGTCEGDEGSKTCSYEEQQTTCQHGCEDGGCLPDPCDGKTCDSPPSATCADSMTLTSYETPGTCQSDDGGSCDYQETEKSCPHGCMNGACQPGPCEMTTCDMPPMDKCDGETAVTYEQMGTCRETDDGTECDYEPSFENCAYKGAECMDASCVNPVTQKGGPVIVEYMANPDVVRDRDGEWFEVYNPGSSSVDLKDWQITSQGNDDHTISESVTVPAGGRVLLARSMDPAGDGSVTPDYVYGDILMANDSDSLQLKDTSGAIADRVFYEVGAIMSGHSRKLDPSLMASASNNDDFTNWCPSLQMSESYGGGDYGTPGQPNEMCKQMACQGYMCEKPTAFCKDGDAIRPTMNMASCTVSRFNNPNCDFGVKTFNCTNQQLCVSGMCEAIPQNAPQQGEVVITEMMGNPKAVSDTKGEWIEVYNTTSNKLSLFSIIIEDNEMGGAKDSYTVVETGAEVPANGYAVFAVETDMTKNGGISGAYHYKGSHLKNSPSMMTVKLVRQDGTLIDEAHYGDPKSGVAQQLDKASYEGVSGAAGSNDTATNWCDASGTYGSGDKGTPGAANIDCP